MFASARSSPKRRLAGLSEKIVVCAARLNPFRPVITFGVAPLCALKADMINRGIAGGAGELHFNLMYLLSFNCHTFSVIRCHKALKKTVRDF